MQSQISWLLQKPTDLDLHCLLGQGRSCSAREGLNIDPDKGSVQKIILLFLPQNIPGGSSHCICHSKTILMSAHMKHFGAKITKNSLDYHKNYQFSGPMFEIQMLSRLSGTCNIL